MVIDNYAADSGTPQYDQHIEKLGVEVFTLVSGQGILIKPIKAPQTV